MGIGWPVASWRSDIVGLKKVADSGGVSSGARGFNEKVDGAFFSKRETR
jgi:hypothetical protein